MGKTARIWRIAERERWSWQRLDAALAEAEALKPRRRDADSECHEAPPSPYEADCQYE